VPFRVTVPFALRSRSLWNDFAFVAFTPRSRYAVCVRVCRAFAFVGCALLPFSRSSFTVLRAVCLCRSAFRVIRFVRAHACRFVFLDFVAFVRLRCRVTFVSLPRFITPLPALLFLAVAALFATVVRIVAFAFTVCSVAPLRCALRLPPFHVDSRCVRCVLLLERSLLRCATARFRAMCGLFCSWLRWSPVCVDAVGCVVTVCTLRAVSARCMIG